jgi:hypothetical protein
MTRSMEVSARQRGTVEGRDGAGSGDGRCKDGVAADGGGLLIAWNAGSNSGSTETNLRGVVGVAELAPVRLRGASKRNDVLLESGADGWGVQNDCRRTGSTSLAGTDSLWIALCWALRAALSLSLAPPQLAIARAPCRRDRGHSAPRDGP